MSIEVFVVDLESKAEFNLVPIDPIFADPDAQEAVSISQIDGTKQLVFGGTMDYTTTLYDVNIYSDKFSRLKTMQDKVILDYNGFAGVIGGVLFKKISVISNLQTATSTTPRLYQAIIQLEVIT